MGLFDLFRKNDGKPKINAAELAAQLEEAGFFKYADPQDIPEIKKDLTAGFSGDPRLAFSESDNSYTKDYRHFYIDSEALFESEGFPDLLGEIKPIFERMNCPLEITDFQEEMDDNDRWNQSITLNGKNYIIFKNFPGVGWDEAMCRFTEIINDQLALQNLDERLYLLMVEEAIFLTDKQFSLLSQLLKDGPITVEEYQRMFDIDPNSYDQS